MRRLCALLRLAAPPAHKVRHHQGNGLVIGLIAGVFGRHTKGVQQVVDNFFPEPFRCQVVVHGISLHSMGHSRCRGALRAPYSGKSAYLYYIKPGRADFSPHRRPAGRAPRGISIPFNS